MSPQTDWRSEAACRGAETRLFFPDSPSHQVNVVLAREARAVCAGCPVARECHDFAQTSNRGHRESAGIWAGVNYEGKGAGAPPKWETVERRLDLPPTLRELLGATG